jgi:hypothetical protein
MGPEPIANERSDKGPSGDALTQGKNVTVQLDDQGGADALGSGPVGIRAAALSCAERRWYCFIKVQA